MKKRIFTLLLASILCMSVVPSSFALENSENNAYAILDVNTKYLSYEITKTELTNQDEYRFIDPEKVTMSMNALDASSEQYLYSVYEYQSHVLQGSNSKPVINQVFLCSVARGQTITLSQTRTTTGTIEFLASYNSNLKDAVRTKVGANGSFSLSFSETKGTSYTYPSEKPGNTASFYLGSGFDKYQYTYKLYDVYQVGQTGGLAWITEKRYIKTEYPVQHIPRKTVYSETSSV